KYIVAFYHLPLDALHASPSDREEHSGIAYLAAELFAHQFYIGALADEIRAFPKSPQFRTCRSSDTAELYMSIKLRILSHKISYSVLAAKKYPIRFWKLFDPDLFKLDQAFSFHLKVKSL